MGKGGGMGKDGGMDGGYMGGNEAWAGEIIGPLLKFMIGGSSVPAEGR